MGPGHTMWFQVWADGWSGDGPFALELLQAPTLQAGDTAFSVRDGG